MICLRELSKSDILTVNKWRNDTQMIDYLGANFRYINIETDEYWFDNYQKNRNTQVRCAICIENSNKFIGLVSLTNIHDINKNAEFHIMIGESCEVNKGYGTIAIKIMLNHGFNNLNLNRIELKVLETNLRAIRSYEKVGFVKEGLLRNVVFKNGEYINMIVMGILKHEYLFIK